MELVLVICAIGIGLYLITHAWFWCAVFGLCALASLFSMLASIVAFQIIGALGFLLLTFLSWAAFIWVVERKYD